MTDTYTREEEDAFEYVCRHTLLRPRDLMTIGDRLSALRPDERRNELRLKEAVNQAATEIAHEYLAEIAPYVGDLELERLFHRLPGHILTRAEVDEIFNDYSAAASEGEHVFHALYRVGLLGYVQHDLVRGEWRQRFLRPGEATLEPMACCRVAPTIWYTRYFPMSSGASIRGFYSESTGRTSLVTSVHGTSRATSIARKARIPPVFLRLTYMATAA